MLVQPVVVTSAVKPLSIHTPVSLGRYRIEQEKRLRTCEELFAEFEFVLARRTLSLEF